MINQGPDDALAPALKSLKTLSACGMAEKNFFLNFNFIYFNLFGTNSQ